MPRRVVEVKGRTYTISMDDPMPLTQRIWAVVSARIVDEMTLEPPRSRVSINTDVPDLTPRVTSDGLAGLIGIPGQVFPNLTAQSYEVDLTITAEGYIPYRERVTIAQNVDFPEAFVPTEIAVLMHRRPIVMAGRTVRRVGNTMVPVPGARVRITGVWRNPPPADLDPPAEAPNVVSLHPPLAFARATGIGSLRRRNITPVVGEDKRLLVAVAPGETQLRLSDRVNLASGDVIEIEGANPGRMEYLTIDTVSGASTADQPADITLNYPLAYSHHDDVVVRKVIPQAPGTGNLFRQNAIKDDTCVFLATMNDLSGTSVAEVSGGGSPTEYHVLHLFTVASDADGYYRLPPLSRVARLEIEAVHGVQTITQTISPDYTRRENRIDFVFR